MAAIHLPRAIRIGGGVLDELPAALGQFGLTRPLIVTDGWIATSGVLQRVLDILARAGIAARTFADAVPDPTVSCVEAACAFLREGAHDCVIGLGGGSPIDTAKIVAVKGLRDVAVRDLKAPHQEDAPGLPIIAIPTTAGTGAEVGRAALLTALRVANGSFAWTFCSSAALRSFVLLGTLKRTRCSVVGRCSRAMGGLRM